jgi:hypothetical protein
MARSWDNVPAFRRYDIASCFNNVDKKFGGPVKASK